ncbi:LacI family DNA-binding transcriptional regulator [Microbacterium murale]|uniref:DNA-binding LacI/PurR family transcriptional regulator n=1 Tax=Microbacterium murale TaxID=1081040 RepID=A0ABU0P8S8_9MICO|nr:LacI family DNA-binding transcriptional regulator [Microbacterium murale]MDQ0643735.1 DNA-binding LacI/PurR family transcriptional regulator [Microbacterium murale]
MPRTTGAPRRRTLQDVAEALDLTVNTVSRALRDLPGVSDETRARIKAEAERIGYVPNANARSLVLGSRRTIGVIITDLANPFFNDLVTEIEEQAIQEGYTLLLLLSDEDPDREQFAVDTALRSGVDGIIAVPVQGRSNPWTAVTKAGIPLVIVARELPDLEADFYSSDNETGRRMTTAALIERGARDIVLVEEDLQISTVAHRLGGFRDALEAHGIPFDSRRDCTRALTSHGARCLALARRGCSPGRSGPPRKRSRPGCVHGGQRLFRARDLRGAAGSGHSRSG